MSEGWSPPEFGAPSAPPPKPAFPTALITALAAFLIVASFAGGILAERFVIQSASGGETVGPSIDQIVQLLEDESYFWPEDEAAQETLRASVSYGALQGALNNPADAELVDPYTTFLPPAEAEAAAQQLDGEYEGIGVYIDVIDGRLTIVSPMPGSPAEEAGLLPDDVLVAVDGQSLLGLSRESAQGLVQGPEGTTVQLTIERPGQPEPFVLAVERRRIDTPVVDYQLDEGSSVAVIAVAIFNDKTTEQLDAALARAVTEEATGIVLDLRYNGGGWVSAAQEMVGRFVPVERGVALYEDDDAAPDNELIEVPILGGGEQIFDLPLVVLVNGGTASAAEIVAGALKAFDRAEIVGDTTFGKGSVQRVHEFSDNSSLRVTIALWLTPDQTVIDREGITPDVAIANPEEDASGQDLQRERAIEVVSAGATAGVDGVGRLDDAIHRS